MIQRQKRWKNQNLYLFIALLIAGTFAFSAKDALGDIKAEFYKQAGVFDKDDLDSNINGLKDRNPILTTTFPNIDFPLNPNHFEHKNKTRPNSVLAGGNYNDFFAIFSGYLKPLVTGNYHFHVRSDDGFRLKIDGKEVIEFMGVRGMAETSTASSKHLEKGKYYWIELTYFQDRGASGLELWWTDTASKKEIIPATYFVQDLPAPLLVSPSLGTDGKVEVIVDKSVSFEVSSPASNIETYEWKVDEETDFSRGGNKKSIRFSEAKALKIKVRVKLKGQNVKREDIFSPPLEISVSVVKNLLKGTSLSLKEPVKGANGKVNVAVGEQVRFEVTSNASNIRKYEWQNVRAGINTVDTGWESTTANKKSFTFDEATEFTLYVRVMDKDGATTDPIGIPVRAWKRPIIISPPNATPSWHAESLTFYGLKDSAIPLQAAAELNGNEAVDKYIWLNQSDEVVAIQTGKAGLAGEFFSFPSSLKDNIDDINSHVRDNNLAPNFSAVFETIDFPNSKGTMKHKTQKDINGNLIDTGLSNLFFARFIGGLDIKVSGTYKFHVSSDDGFRLRINGQTVPSAEHIGGRVMQETTAEYNFPTAGLYTLELTYFEYSYDQGLELRWTPPNKSKEIIPKEAFTAAAIYLPKAANLNGRLKVKAVSNFGISSEKKDFNVKVYDALDLKPGGPYTGRPKIKPVVLEGSVNVNAYPGADIQYEWRSKEDNKVIASGTSPRAEFIGAKAGTVAVEFSAIVTTQEKVIFKKSAETTILFEAGVPTAMPNGPYRGGIEGGSFTPIPFQGNDPNFIEAEDIGKIDRWRWALDPANKALQFENSSYLKVAKAVALGDNWSIAAWFKYPLPKTATYNTLLHGADHHIVAQGGNKLGSLAGTTFHDSKYTFPKDLAPGWHHIAAVGSAKENVTSFYLDGIKVGNITFKSTSNITTIGNFQNGNQAFGSVDEVVVFTKALNAEEVEDLFHSRPIKAKEKELAAYWKFDEGSGDTVFDAAGNGSAATLVNNPKWVDSEVFVTSTNAISFNPTFAYDLAGSYKVKLKVRGETGRWSPIKETTVTVVDGKIQGLIKAADLRTPVKGVRLTLTSPHVKPETLTRKARSIEGVLQLDGLDDSVEISGLKLAKQSFSFTLWAKRERASVKEWLLSQGTASPNAGLQVGFLENNVFSFSFYNNDLKTTVPYSDTDWHFWVGTYNATSKDRRLYRDGKLVVDDKTVGNYEGSGLLFLGRDFLGKGFFKGAIDEVSFFNRVLSPTEVIDIYFNRAPTDQGGLLGFWSFDDMSVASVADVSGNGNNGILVGAMATVGQIPLIADESGNIFTTTDKRGFYSFEKLPLGSYNVEARKIENMSEHEFEKNKIATELTLSGTDQLAVDFVDLSVFPISGRIVYRLQKQGQDVFVDNVVVKAQPVGSTSTLESLPSSKSPNAVGANYSLPLFAGNYLFKAEGSGHDLRINEKSPGFNSATQLVTIKTATTGIDFIDFTTRKITVFVEDSGGFPIEFYQKNRIKARVNGDNGFAEGEVKKEGEKTFFEAVVPPGKYTITLPNVPEAISKSDKTKKEAEVDVTALSETSTTMIVPVPIELKIGPEPKLINLPTHVTDALGLKSEDIPEGFMCYIPDPNETQTHIYTIKATANANKVEDFTLKVVDNISQSDYTPASEKTYTGAVDRYEVETVEGVKVGKYTVSAGIPVMSAVNEADPNSYLEFTLPDKKTKVKLPKPLPKTITFRASKEGYKDSILYTLNVTTLGDVPEGTAAEIVAVPNVNYLVLHDPPGDGSFSSFDDSIRLSGIVDKLRIKNKIDDKEIPVYPSPWSVEREVAGVNFSKVKDKEKDLGDKGLLKPKDRFPAPAAFGIAAVVEGAKGALIVAAGFGGPAAMALQLVNVGLVVGLVSAGVGLVQYEISPNRHFETPAGDQIPDIMGPGKGDVYYGEGWTLGLQTKFRLRIKKNPKADPKAPNYDPKDDPIEPKAKWLPATEQILTYAVLNRDNQYAYTVRDIEKIIKDLELQIAGGKPEDEKKTADLKNAKKTWEGLLEKNPAYIWQKEHIKGETLFSKEASNKKADRKELETFLKEKFGDQKGQLLIFSGGQTFEYSRSISESATSTFSTSVSISTKGEAAAELKAVIGTFAGLGAGVTTTITGTGAGGSLEVGSEQALGVDLESGVAAEQSVGFTLNDDDVGDNISAYVYEGPWGTPIFFTEPGSVTSDPWQPGTNKGVDVKLELVEQPTNPGPFDYQGGAHYKVKGTYLGKKVLEQAAIDFYAYALADSSPNAPFVKIGGPDAIYSPIKFSKSSPIVNLAISIFPPSIDLQNSEEKEYLTVIRVEEIADGQIFSPLTLKPKFADLKAPRATITAPYDGQRLSPSVFTDKSPFLVQLFCDDEDVARIQLQLRAKQTNGVWEPWRNLDGLIWEDEKVYPKDKDKLEAMNKIVTIVAHADRSPPRKEFTFQWSGTAINALGVGEYALRAVASDKASRLQPDGSQQPKPNVDLDAPIFAFQVDGSKPTVLTTIPFYQDPEKARLYKGELSVSFNDDMKGDDFSDRTLVVKDLLNKAEVVGGFVSYSPALRKAIFVPIVPFQANGFYRVEVKTDVELAEVVKEIKEVKGVKTEVVKVGADSKPITITKIEKGVHDLAGNPLDSEFTFTFRTADTPFEETWNITLKATDGSSTDANNILGVAFGAADAEDTQDARAVPRLAAQMSLSFLNRVKEEFDRDMRPADGRLEHHWFFVIDNPKAGSKVQIFWQPSIKLRRVERQYQLIRLVEFDAKGTVTSVIALDPTDSQLRDKEGLAYEYTPKAGETSRHFRLDLQKAGLVATKLEKGSSGWKFFSAPIIPQRPDPFVNLGDDIDDLKLYHYDAKLSGYKIYPLDLGEVALIAGRGYFTRLKQGVEVDVGGAPTLEAITLELKDVGWYALGNPFTLAVNLADLKFNNLEFDQAAAAGLIENTLYRWKAVVGAVDLYEAVKVGDKLQPWEGYWLRTKEKDLKLTIRPPSGLANFIAPLPDSYQPALAPPLAAATKPTPGQFELRLALTSDLASDLITTLGARPEAKLGLDTFDSSEPPTLSGTVSVYFDHSDWPDQEQPGLYNNDYQPPLAVGEERHWQFVVYSDNTTDSGALNNLNNLNPKLRLSWEEAIENLPPDTMFYLRQLDAEEAEASTAAKDWQDMRQVRFVELKAKGRITKLQFELKAVRFELTPPEAISVVAGEKQVKLSWKANKARTNLATSFIDRYSIEKWKLGNGIKAKMVEMVGPASSPVGEGESATTEPTAPMAQYSIRPQLLAETDGSGYEFIDTEVEEDASYAYQLAVHFKTGAALKSEFFLVTVQPIIKSTRLLQNYPNPFNPETWIPYELKQDAKVSIRIYNVNGQLVRALDLGYQAKGRYLSRQKAAYWDGRNETGERAASGVYFYAIQAGKFVAAKKMVVVK